MITLTNPKWTKAAKQAAKVTGKGGMLSPDTISTAGMGLGGFYGSRVITKGAGNLVDWISAKAGFTIGPVILRVLVGVGSVYGLRVVGIILNQMNMGKGSGNAFTLGGLLGILQGLVVSPMVANMPEGMVKDTLQGEGDWGGNMMPIPSQPLAGGAYGTEWDETLAQPYYQDLAGDPSQYDSVNLDGDEEVIFSSY